MQILTEQCERQIGPDGAYCEQSTCYQRYTAEIYLHAMILASQNGFAFPGDVRDRVQALLDNLLWIRAPNGSMPMIGDADGGWLLPLARRRPDDLRGIFSTAAAWFGRAEFADAAGGRVAPETLWLLGAPGLDAFEAIRAAPPRAAASRLFPDGGTVTMRASWRSDAHQLVFDVAPLAPFGHTHADLLGVQCAVFGEPYIIDAGTYCYTADAAWRDYFRSTAAHSTVTIDGLGQATPDRPFSWKGRPVTRVHDWHSTAEIDYADASHDAYGNLPDPVVHRRRVLFAKPRYWVLVDDLAGRTHHRIELRFQFAPVEVTLEPSGWARASGSGGQGLLLRSYSSAHLELSFHSGSLEPIAGWISRDYGQRQPAPMLICSAAAPLPLRIVTLLLPVGDVAAGPPAIAAQSDQHGAIGGLAFELTGERIQVSDESVSLVSAGNARS